MDLKRNGSSAVTSINSIHFLRVCASISVDFVHFDLIYKTVVHRHTAAEAAAAHIAPIHTYITRPGYNQQHTFKTQNNHINHGSGAADTIDAAETTATS